MALAKCCWQDGPISAGPCGIPKPLPCMTSKGLSLQLRQGPAGLGPKEHAEPRLVETQNVRLIEVERSVSVGHSEPWGGAPCSVSVDPQWVLGGGGCLVQCEPWGGALCSVSVGPQWARGWGCPVQCDCGPVVGTGGAPATWLPLTPTSGQNATLVAEKAALQGQLQHLEGQLGSLQGRAQELLLQSQRAQEHSSRLQVGGCPGAHPCPCTAPSCPFWIVLWPFSIPAPSQLPHLFYSFIYPCPLTPATIVHHPPCRCLLLPAARPHICTCVLLPSHRPSPPLHREPLVPFCPVPLPDSLA